MTTEQYSMDYDEGYQDGWDAAVESSQPLTNKQAMKLALSALEYWDVHGKLHQPTEEAITALREALAAQPSRTLEELYALSREVSAEQPAQQEPWSNVVIGVDVAKEGVSVTGIYKVSNDSSHLFYSQFYAAQAQRNPLTVGQVKEAMMDAKLHYWGDDDLPLVIAIEAAHGIKEKRHD
jgi:hypothetical protein